MLASNPVDPSDRYAIEFSGTPGPASPYRRDDERGLGGSVNLLAAAALLVIAYIVIGFATASAPAPAAGKVPTPAGYGPVATPVTGDFRLGPGNNDAPGIVVAVGDGVALPVDLHGGTGGEMSPAEILPFR